MTIIGTTRADRPVVARFAWLFVLALAVALTGCSSSSDDDSGTQQQSDASSDSDSDSDAGSDSGSESSEVPPLASEAVSLDDGHAVGSAHWGDGNTSTGGQGQAVDGLECTESVSNNYHVHSHLSIILNGEALMIPVDVGAVPSSTNECHYPVHTHDESGLIHLHGQEPTDYTLGQFFDLWGQPLEPDNVAGLMNMPVVVYITEEDGTTTEYTGDFSEIQLTSHRLITIQVGEPITEIPNFTWSFD